MNKTWKLLLVEDDKDSAESLISLFEFHDIETLWSIDGSAALQTLDSIERLRQRPPDFVLLDVNLPNTDTVQLGREIIAHSIGYPVILVSASSPLVLEGTASRIGALAALRKPFSMDELLAILRQHGPRQDDADLNRRAATPR